jgi:hypothetical protein
MILLAADDDGCCFGHHCCWRAGDVIIKIAAVKNKLITTLIDDLVL